MIKENIVAKLDVSENKIQGSAIDEFNRIEVVGYKVTIYNQGNSLYANKEHKNKDILLIKSLEGDIGDTFYLLKNNKGQYTGSKFKVNGKFALDTFYEILNKDGLNSDNGVLPIANKKVKYTTENIDMILR